MPGRPDGAGFIRPWQAAHLARWKFKAGNQNFWRRLGRLIHEYPDYMRGVLRLSDER